MNATTTGSALLLAMLAGCSNEPTPPAPDAATVIVTGTSVTVKIATPLSSATTKPGETFEASLEEPLRKGTQVVAPKGSLVEGRLVAAGPGSGPRIAVELSTLQVAGRIVHIATNTIEREAKANKAGTRADEAAIPKDSVMIFELKEPLAIP